MVTVENTIENTGEHWNDKVLEYTEIGLSTPGSCLQPEALLLFRWDLHTLRYKHSVFIKFA